MKVYIFRFKGLNDSILIERGECGYWKQTEVELFKKDIRNVLRHLQLLNDEMESVSMTPEEVENILYLYTECAVVGYLVYKRMSYL